MPKRYRSGLVVGKFAPLHRGHQRLIEAALDACERVVAFVWSSPDFPAMPVPVRAGWLHELYPELDVVAFEAGAAPPDTAPDAVHHAFVHAHLPFPVEAVFTAEAYGPGFATALRAEHVSVGFPRAAEGPSGTRLRADVHTHRQWLDPRVYAHFVERVVLLGAESSGKTTLARALAARLGTAWVPEYGRALWEAQNGQLALDDFVRIAETHRQHEDEAALGAHCFLFVDTNALTTQLYAFFYHGTCPDRVQALAASCAGRYARTFVCAPDFPFAQDGTRLPSEVQRYMDGAVRHDLALRGIAYTVLKGPLEARVETVIRALGV